MSEQHSSHVEPSAAATVEDRRRFLSLSALFLAGPTIWMVHFFVVYLPAEALCQTDARAKVLGRSAVSVITLVATAVAVAAITLTTHLAYRRWRNTGIGWDGSNAPELPSTAGGWEHDGEVALAGFLLGVLFLLAILFVGLPALALAC